MPDIFIRLSKPYRSLVNLERLWRMDHRYELTPLEYATLHIIRGYEVLLKGYDPDTAARKHLAISDLFRKLLLDLALKGTSIDQVMVKRSILQTIDRMLEDVAKHEGPVQ
jgi:hypothetical protein